VQEFPPGPVVPRLPDHRFYRVHGDGRGRALRAECECGWSSLGSQNGGLAGAGWDAHVAELTAAADILDRITAVADSLIARVAACGTAAQVVLDAGVSLADIEREQLVTGIRTDADATIVRLRELIRGGDSG